VPIWIKKVKRFALRLVFYPAFDPKLEQPDFEFGKDLQIYSEGNMGEIGTRPGVGVLRFIECHLGIARNDVRTNRVLLDGLAAQNIHVKMEGFFDVIDRQSEMVDAENHREIIG
jgi:hypothetical protein